MILLYKKGRVVCQVCFVIRVGIGSSMGRPSGRQNPDSYGGYSTEDSPDGLTGFILPQVVREWFKNGDV
jgi:hypothetical protein